MGGEGDRGEGYKIWGGEGDKKVGRGRTVKREKALLFKDASIFKTGFILNCVETPWSLIRPHLLTYIFL